MKGPQRPKVAWIVPSADAGGIGPVALETAAAVAANGGCEATLIETHGAPRGDQIEANGLRRVALDMGGTQAPATVVLDWLREDRQGVVFTNDVSHLHEIFPHFPQDTIHVAVLHDAARRYRDDVLSYANFLHGVVAVSDYVFGWAQKDLRAAGFSGPIRTIHNGTSYPPATARTQPAGPLRLLFIGDLLLKGGAQLLPIIKSLQRRGVDFQLSVITAEPKPLQDRLLQADVTGSVKFLARFNRAELWRVYAAHDVLLMLSAGEPFGMVTIEAMGMGCVPVAYEVPSGTREIIEPGLSGLLVPPRPDAVAAAIAELAGARLQVMSAEAMRRARTVFTSRRTAEEYIELVEALMRSRTLAAAPRSLRGAESRDVKPRQRSILAHFYHFLPPVVRRHVRKALGSHPRSFRWLRERL